MAKSIRQGSHMLVFASEEEWNKLQAHDLYITGYDSELVDYDWVIAQLEERYKKRGVEEFNDVYYNCMDCSETSHFSDSINFRTIDKEEIEIFARFIIDCRTIEEYLNCGYLETYSGQYTTEGGETIYVFGYYD